MIPDGTPTGMHDHYKTPIYIGDRVQDLDGNIGTVIFAHGAIRVDAFNGSYLRYNSSLLFGDNRDPRTLRVIR